MFNLLTEGKTCWRVAPTENLSFLIDADKFFTTLRSAFQLAKHRIFIVAWNFDEEIIFKSDGNEKKTLGAYLHELVESSPQLEIYILVWKNAVLYAKNLKLFVSHVKRWKHPRIHFQLDDHHPWFACHHEKIICIDDGLAFVGGIDLVRRRWDNPKHVDNKKRRLYSIRKSYSPVHDVQVIVDGEAARSLSLLAEERWRAATGEAPLPVPPTDDCWPPVLAADVHEQDVGIARTRPAYDDQAKVDEIRHLNEAALRQAREAIYLESQYFAVPELTRILADHLGKKDGPEIIIVVNVKEGALLERFVMAGNRDRLFAVLHKADRWGKLRLFYPINKEGKIIRIHSKVMIVDDVFARVGSSNINCRSLGLDTECDIAWQARNDHQSKAIRLLRDRLLAEHLAIPVEEFQSSLAVHKKLVPAIDSLNNNHRKRLVPYRVHEKATYERICFSRLMDPAAPLNWADLFSKRST